MNLRSGQGSTYAGVDQGDNGHGEDNGHTNRDSHKAPLLAPPPPPPPPMTHAEMMAKMLAAQRELAHALEMLAQAIGGFAHGGHCRRTDQFIRVQVQWRPASGRTVILEPI